MRICKVWDADYPWDIRVEKVTDTLAAAGHEVHLVCRNQGRRVRRESLGRLTIHRLPALPRWLGSANTVVNLPHPLNPVWVRAIAGVIRECRPDVVLVRDIPLVLAAAVALRKRRVPIVLDMAENYPAMLRDRLEYTPTSLTGRVVRHPALARLVERISLRLARHVIVVIEESRDRLVQAGVPASRITIVCNTPPFDRWRKPPLAEPASETRLVYLGNLDGSRGVDVAIRAIAQLKRSGSAAQLAVIGDGPSRPRLQALATELGAGDRVSILGRLSFDRVQATMGRAHIGVIPHYATEAWNTTIPNKLFDYMLLGLPVVVSEARPTARIVRAEGCGRVHRDRDAHDLAACVSALEDPEARERSGAQGRAAVARRYNWDYDAKGVLEAMELAAAGGA